MRVPIVKGRGFTADDRRGGQKVMIVSEALAARAFPGQDPIGKRIACCESNTDGSQAWKVVVGVAGDIRSRGPARAPVPEFYLPLTQAPDAAWNWIQRTAYVLVRTEGPLNLGSVARGDRQTRSRRATLRHPRNGSAARRDAGHGAFQHAAARFSAASACCSRPVASTASSPTSSRSGRRRSASASRSARRRPASCG